MDELTTLVKQIFAASIQAHKNCHDTMAPLLIEAATAVVEALHRGNKVMIFGNGGSAADAQHLAAEFVNRFMIERPPLPAVALTTDTSILTSIGNDYDFKEIFSKQIKALGLAGDVAWGISTSGRSANVVEALKVARAREMTTIGMTGADGGEVAAVADILLRVEAKETPRIQECHITMGHIICELVDYLLFQRIALP